MELSGRDKEMGIPPSSGYPSLASSGSGGRGNEHHHKIDNGTSTFKPSQIPHSHPLLQQEQELNSQPQSLPHGCSPDPDPLHVAGVVSGATIPSITGGSNSKASVRYRECLKNHAASIGGNIVDGCGEFMPDGEEGTLEALMCAACNCHRNFHRKEVDGEPNGRSAPHFSAQPPALASPPYLHRHKFPPKGFHAPSTFIIPPMSMAFGASVGATESSSEDLRAFDSNAGASAPPPPPPAPSLSKKRFRTKFTQEQKDKMLEYAEKVGWRMQKQYEDQVQKLCAEVGVKRQVFKVWMHNNKNTLKKHQEPQQQTPPL